MNALTTAFETRNVGVTLEAEATVLDNGKRIHVSVVPQRVTLVEMEPNDTALPEKNIVVRIPQPLFSTAKTTPGSDSTERRAPIARRSQTDETGKPSRIALHSSDGDEDGIGLSHRANFTRVKTLLFFVLIVGGLRAGSFGQDGLQSPVTVVSEPVIYDPPARRELPSRAVSAYVQAKWNVRIDLQMVVLDEIKAFDLIPDFHPRKKRKCRQPGRGFKR
ncbi:MAG: hypothetical protein WDN28_12020 [Chthoniobacter sp.]